MATRSPKLRDDLLIKRQVMGGEVTYLIKVRETQQYLRFREMEWAIISRLNGENTYEDLAAAFNQQFPDTELDAGQVEDFVDSLRKQEVIERSAAERSIVILEKLQAERKKRAESSQAKDVFYLTLGHVNPDRFYKAIHPYIRWIWTPPFVVATLCYFALAALLIVGNWGAVRDGMLHFWNFSEKSTADIVLLFCILAVVIAIHESAHALTCINFGGEVTELGFMLIFFAPAFYANVSDAYLFDKKWHKYWVTLAGGYSELIICSTAVFTWVLSEPESFLNHVAYNTMVFAGVSTIIFNYNPLIKLDGYYLLSDILEISNLRENSAAYISYLLRKKIYRLPATPPSNLTPRKRRIYLIYGLLSTLYIIVIVTFFILFVFRLSVGAFPEFGLFLGTYLAYLILKKRLQKLMSFSKFLFLDKRELLKTKASARRWALAVVGGVLLLLLFPFPRSINAPVVLEPGRRLALVAEGGGIVAEVADGGGRQVPAGSVLIRLVHPELSARRMETEAEISRLGAEAARALSLGAPSAYQAAIQAQRAAERRRLELLRQEELLAVRAPFEGVVLTSRLQDLVGKHVEKGERLCEFGSSETVRARITVSEFALREISEQAQVKLKLLAFPGGTFSGRLTRRSLASADAYDSTGRTSDLVRAAYLQKNTKAEASSFSHFEVLAEFSNEQARLRPGMSGNAKIIVHSRSLLMRGFVAAQDVLRSRIWW
jgi:putative peptide zinc metalloprotease protein